VENIIVVSYRHHHRRRRHRHRDLLLLPGRCCRHFHASISINIHTQSSTMISRPKNRVNPKNNPQEPASQCNSLYPIPYPLKKNIAVISPAVTKFETINTTHPPKKNQPNSQVAGSTITITVWSSTLARVLPQRLQSSAYAHPLRSHSPSHHAPSRSHSDPSISFRARRSRCVSSR